MRIPAFIHLPGDAVASAPAARPVAQGFARIAMGLRRWMETRRALAELAQMDEAMLRDIGVSRWELRAHLTGRHSH